MKFRENSNLGIAGQDHPWASILEYANRKLIRNFLLVINSNFVYAISTRAPLRFKDTL